MVVVVVTVDWFCLAVDEKHAEVVVKSAKSSNNWVAVIVPFEVSKNKSATSARFVDVIYSPFRQGFTL